MLKKSKKNFYNLNVNNITDNKDFGKTINPPDQKSNLVENDKVLSESLNLLKYFGTVMRILWKTYISKDQTFLSYTLIQY